MQSHRRLAVAMALLLPLTLGAGEMMQGHIMANADGLNWAPGPGSLPAGSQVAVLEGNPGAAGPFTLRLRFPANYQIKPHWHPTVEHVSVLTGTLYMGLGETYDEDKAKALTPGGFAAMDMGTRHYAFTKDEGTVIQLHGMGPWGITYVNPKDDPRQ
ncbi:cupin domain-containing protein [Gallaecimonas xiamenensis]|uniref:Cupin n=1 Tax=Gallaecimonas xiamenensis 3-C-1 TaxID=745411 RepID=K2IXI7_9GAMM|nr:cupin domain-containing protein [Gallaecimonas xiamenensis]EKE75141.1 hypothetical protein B3C1_07691 [Gallaecimonas xiamenensis 3-C-1]